MKNFQTRKAYAVIVVEYLRMWKVGFPNFGGLVKIILYFVESLLFVESCSNWRK